jgi:hypothetical protein
MGTLSDAPHLRSDGPLGGSPITFLDATPAELAAAAVEHGVTEQTAQLEFVCSFDRSAVESCLNGDFAPASRDGEVPGYFRYLILTAFVSATEEGVGDNHNFRDRLGALLGGNTLNSVSGVNTLWRGLEGWCKRRRAAGKSIRAVVLPPYGNMNLIGYAVRIAFPSWRDRSAFTRVLRTVPAETRSHPERLCRELVRPQQLVKLPQALRGAFDDFQHQMRVGWRMLLGHRFWTLVRSINAQLEEEQHGTRAVHWTLEARFGGWEQDVLELRLSQCTVRGALVGEGFEGSLERFVAIPARDLPVGLANAVQEGVLILGEGPGASWILSDGGTPDDVFVLVLARDDSIARRSALKTKWQSLGSGWWVSGRLDPVAMVDLFRVLGYGPLRDSQLADVTLAGGVKTGRASWLGRPALLPTVSASRASRLSVRLLEGSEDILILSGVPPEWQLEISKPASGRWLLSAVEGPHETDKVLVLEADAPERWEWPEIDSGKFAADMELAFENARPETIRPLAIGAETHSANLARVGNLLEAIYGGAPSLGWAESELVPLLEPHLPQRHFVWDFLRGLAEAGWLEPVLSLGWRARRWQLRRPSLLPLSPGAALVDGAVAAASEHRLVEAVSRRGGRLTRRSALSEWAPSALFIEVSDLAELAIELAWPMCEPHAPEFAAAPRCWPGEQRTTKGRELSGIWSFEVGLFHPPDAGQETQEGVVLQRWVRERKDDRDVFRVVSRGQDFVTSSRTAAILEAYRCRRTPLFRWFRGRLERVARAGHLPLPVARSLRRRFLTGSGPTELREDRGSYVYVADANAARWLRKKFGPVIAGVPADDRDQLKGVVAARRTGTRTLWLPPLARLRGVQP